MPLEGQSHTTPNNLPVSWRRWCKYAMVFSFLWLLLTEVEPGSLVIGILVVPLATWCAISLFKSSSQATQKTYRPLSLISLLRFMPFFLWQSLKGGCETAAFAVLPQRRVYSGFLIYNMKLPPGAARLFFINTVSLLPGTGSSKWQGDRLIVHALDTRSDHYEALQQCEQQVARLFGITLLDENANTGDDAGKNSMRSKVDFVKN